MMSVIARPMPLLRVGVALALAGGAAALQAQNARPGNPLDQLPAPTPVPAPRDPAPRVELRAPAGPTGNRLEQSFTATRFDIEGVRALPFERVAALFAPLAGRPTTAAQLVQRATEASALYRDAGHPLSFVFVPDQTFAGGVVRVVAVEGYLSGLRIEGDAGPATPKLREIAAPLLAERPLRQATFERVTQLLARMPGLTVAATASMPGTTDGATELVLKVKRVPYDVSLGADLRQPRSRAVLNGVWNDPFVAGGQLSASTLVGDFSREKLFTLGYTQLVGADGLAWRTSLTRYSGYPDSRLGRGAPLERRNTNQRAELSASQPLRLDTRGSLTLNGGFYAVDNSDDYRVPANGVTLSEDTRVRALFAQLAYVDATPGRSRSASALLAHGIDGLGARAVVRSNIDALNGVGLAQTDFTRVPARPLLRRLGHGRVVRRAVQRPVARRLGTHRLRRAALRAWLRAGRRRRRRRLGRRGGTQPAVRAGPAVAAAGRALRAAGGGPGLDALRRAAAARAALDGARAAGVGRAPLQHRRGGRQAHRRRGVEQPAAQDAREPAAELPAVGALNVGARRAPPQRAACCRHCATLRANCAARPGSHTGLPGTSRHRPTTTRSETATVQAA
jgi:hemolysin activation/secretion protein